LKELLNKINNERKFPTPTSESELKVLLVQYEHAVESYVPVLIHQAKILWERGDYPAVERLFKKSAEYCNNDVWKENVGHTLFMQDGKWKEAIMFYEPLMKESEDQVNQLIISLLSELISFA